MPDCRIQKVDSYTGRYRDMYLCDNEMQLLTAMEDFEYTKCFDPDMVPCYVKDSVSSQNPSFPKFLTSFKSKWWSH